jgi:hypothetical protein
MTSDNYIFELTHCFSASPVSADVNVTRVQAILEKIRKDERERCAQKAELLASSWRSNPHYTAEMCEISVMACDLLAAAIRS